ncbi:hypothetical protein JCM24511_06933 [Saitozyma sp. JCM 24511]|nr:hypothetical protein JCM24511_06933 [Saitozyma sp. JCM 24511]
MSRDPYIDVKRLHPLSEVEQTLSATHNLLASYERIASTSSSTSSAVSEARDELRGTLALLEADLEDLDESVRVVESTGDRWGIGPDEVSRRRGFVERVKKEVRMIVRKQDDTLGVISGTLHTLASQAGLIGHEVVDQTGMLEDLTGRVDDTDSRLRKVQRTMNDFIQRNEETKSGWCICILIFVLIALLIAVIIT